MSATRRLADARKKRRRIASHLIALEKGAITLESILHEPPECLGNVSLYQVMKRTPRLGPEGIKKCLTNAKIWPETKMVKLTHQERQRIVQHLPPRAKKYEEVTND